ncbi:hypothetical protein E0Z10_g421 [Xylaria hypoxylon]|uniref:GST N-terminal domain-containing protein n=1 Tax=Xylaria hypoxylon TaxID=37992 RepID=A0A4Z0Z9H9_9PEZI|nr:hypothetical protein E0Z10_g421 [Xylaria hypoxylon]
MPLPDADLHPVATGLAKQTVDNHSAEQQLKLFAGWFCPFVQRAWITLEEKGIPYQYIEVNPYNKGPELMRSNPRGLVPTLEVAPGKSLYESTVLSFHRLLQFQPASYEGDGAARLDELRVEFRQCLLEFAGEMVDASQGPFFAGKEIGLVDITLLPWAIRLWIFDEFKGGLGIPEKGDEERWDRWHVWLAAVKERKSVKKTTSDREHYFPLFKRYADDSAQSELAKATRAGRGVP